MNTNKIIFYSILGVMTVGLSLIGYNVYNNWKAGNGSKDDTKNGDDNKDEPTPTTFTPKETTFTRVYSVNDAYSIYKTKSLTSDVVIDYTDAKNSFVGIMYKSEFDVDSDWVKVYETGGKQYSGYMQKSDLKYYKNGDTSIPKKVENITSW